MILAIPDVLPAAQIAALRAALERSTFADGAATAGWNARLVKKNEQLPFSPETRALQDQVSQAIVGNTLFSLAVQPRRMRPILFNRYAAGMAYGAHVDDPIVHGSGAPGDPEALRLDVSFTLFLADPQSYDGGELVTESGGVSQRFKLPAGAMVVYPSTTLHRVEPVTRGVRLAAVGWAQSLIREEGRREVVFDLEMTRRALFDREGKSRDFDTLTKTVANLIRMWAEP